MGAELSLPSVFPVLSRCDFLGPGPGGCQYPGSVYQSCGAAISAGVCGG
jgi:hypothetical protein